VSAVEERICDVQAWSSAFPAAEREGEEVEGEWQAGQQRDCGQGGGSEQDGKQAGDEGDEADEVRKVRSSQAP